MKPLFLALAAAWLISLGISFFIGQGTAPIVQVPVDTNGNILEDQPIYYRGDPIVIESFAPRAASSTEAGKKATFSTLAAKVGDDDVTGGDRPRPSLRKAFVEVSQDSVTRTLKNNDPIARATGFANILANLNAANAREAMQAIDTLPGGFDRSREKSLLLYAWAQVDGAAAMDYIAENKPEAQGGRRPGGWGGRGEWTSYMNSQSVLTGWATADPEGAIGWATENHDGEDNPYLVGIVNGVAKSDPAKATDITYMLPYGRNRGRAVDTLIDSYFQQGDDAAIAWAETLPDTDPTLKKGIVTRVAGKLARTDPFRSADWVIGMTEGEGRLDAIETVAETWGDRDPEQARQWVNGLGDSTERLTAMAEVIGDLARKDIESAANWLNEVEKTEARDPVVERFAMRVRRDNPEYAMIWAAEIQDTNLRQETLERIANEWAARSPEAAKEFLEK